ncbi:hypothetical protein AMS68_007519 [Peltaster fructicola]|uniref:RWD domain-containing protein n=1 Tax=Peltaster fructicola TaxID=286661 RepID=A0A6H0Y4P8_9PEZI|nr:hypothetical protein AMS68_007519 [Peltaster fructicola]
MDDERKEELETIQAIFPEIVLSPTHEFTATLDIPVQPNAPLLLRFIAQDNPIDISVQNGDAQHRPRAHIEHDLHFDHLPPLKLYIQLPKDYPETSPPRVSLSSLYGWVPLATILELQNAVNTTWEDCGRGQTLFAYIDYLQQSAEQGLGLTAVSDGPTILSASLEQTLQTFDRDTKQTAFDAGTYDCGICLEPKKGRSCHKLEKCGHIFCKQCFQDYYNHAIAEGDVVQIRCLDEGCVKTSKGRKRSLHPRELLAIGLDEPVVRRYVEMQRKKKLESDKTTVYCPRTWCQHPARSTKYPPIPANLLDYPDLSDVDEDAPEEPTVVQAPTAPPKRAEQDERLAICEECKFAFCRVCCASWHGSFIRCYPKDSTELTAEDKASYDVNAISATYAVLGSIRKIPMNTSILKARSASSDYGVEEGDDGQGPGDGRGFAGARALEAMAIEAAREAEREEAEAAAQVAEAAQEQPPPVQIVHHPAANVAANERVALAAMANLHLEPQIPLDGVAPVGARPVAARRQRNPFPAHAPARGRAAAVRAHERQGAVGGNARRQNRPVAPPVDEDRRQEDEMRRFVALALRDEEDGWDSDEFAEDDAAWHIR